MRVKFPVTETLEFTGVIVTFGAKTVSSVERF